MTTVDWPPEGGSAYDPTGGPSEFVNSSAGVADAGKGVVLDAIGKLDSSFLPASVVGAMDYKGQWDASGGGTPASTDNGALYRVSVAGTLDPGARPVQVGDFVVYNGTTAQYDIINAAQSSDEVRNDSLFPGSFITEAFNYEAKNDLIRGWNVAGILVSKGVVVKVAGSSSQASPEDEMPEIDAVSAVTDIPLGVTWENVANAAGGFVLRHGLLSGIMDTSAGAVGDSVYYTAAGVLTLTNTGSPVVGYVASVGNPGDVFFDIPTAHYGTFDPDSVYIADISTAADYTAALTELRDNPRYTEGIFYIRASISVGGADDVPFVNKNVTFIGSRISNTGTLPVMSLTNGFGLRYDVDGCTVRFVDLTITVAGTSMNNVQFDQNYSGLVSFDNCDITCNQSGGALVSSGLDGAVVLDVRNCTITVNSSSPFAYANMPSGRADFLSKLTVNIYGSTTTGFLVGTGDNSDPAVSVYVNVIDSVINDGGSGVWDRASTTTTGDRGFFVVTYSGTSVVSQELVSGSNAVTFTMRGGGMQVYRANVSNWTEMFDAITEFENNDAYYRAEITAVDDIDQGTGNDTPNITKPVVFKVGSAGAAQANRLRWDYDNGSRILTGGNVDLTFIGFDFLHNTSSTANRLDIGGNENGIIRFVNCYFNLTSTGAIVRKQFDGNVLVELVNCQVENNSTGYMFVLNTAQPTEGGKTSLDVRVSGTRISGGRFYQIFSGGGDNSESWVRVDSSEITGDGNDVWSVPATTATPAIIDLLVTPDSNVQRTGTTTALNVIDMGLGGRVYAVTVSSDSELQDAIDELNDNPVWQRGEIAIDGEITLSASKSFDKSVRFYGTTTGGGNDAKLTLSTGVSLGVGDDLEIVVEVDGVELVKDLSGFFCIVQADESLVFRAVNCKITRSGFSSAAGGFLGNDTRGFISAEFVNCEITMSGGTAGSDTGSFIRGASANYTKAAFIGCRITSDGAFIASSRSSGDVDIAFIGTKTDWSAGDAWYEASGAINVFVDPSSLVVKDYYLANSPTFDHDALIEKLGIDVTNDLNLDVEIGNNLAVGGSDSYGRYSPVEHSNGSGYSAPIAGITGYDVTRGGVHGCVHGNSLDANSWPWGFIALTAGGSAWGNPYALEDGDRYGGIGFAGHAADGGMGTNMELAAGILPRVDGTPSAGNLPTQLGIYTSRTSRAGLKERLLIGKDGTVYRKAGEISTDGDVQAIDAILYDESAAGPAWNELLIEGTDQLVIPTDTVWTFEIQISAADTSGDAAGYKLEGVIKNDSGTTSIVGAVSKTVLAEDDSSWDVRATADDANDALKIEGYSDDTNEIRYAAHVKLTALAFPTA